MTRRNHWHPCGVPDTTSWYSWGMFYWFPGRYSMLSCARFTIQTRGDGLQQLWQEGTTDIHVVFLIQLSGIAGGCHTGFQVGIACCLVLGSQYRRGGDGLQQLWQEGTTDIHVVFLIQLPGIAGGCLTGFQVGIAYCLVLVSLLQMGWYFPCFLIEKQKAPHCWNSYKIKLKFHRNRKNRHIYMTAHFICLAQAHQ